MKKAIGQTVRDLKREVNKKVLKVPGIEQKVLDATSNEPWGPHGTHLADIAQATRNYHEYQMIMSVIWKRINDTGKNWRHVYKALTVLEYLVAHGSERVIDEIREHAYQISTLSDFQYIDSSGKDQGSNVRKKSQNLVVLVNDKDRIQEARQKASSTREKYRSTYSTGGLYKPGSGGFDDDRNEGRYRDEDRNGYGGEREWNYRDGDRNGRNDDSYGRMGDRSGRDRDSEERYGKDSYRDDDYRGRSRSNDDYQYGSRSRSADNRERAYDDDSRYSARGSGAKADDLSQDGRKLDRKFSEQNLGAPPSYEEAVTDARSPAADERDGESSAAASAPKAASPPPSSSPGQEISAPTTSASPTNQDVGSFDEFDPRNAFSAVPAPAHPPPVTSTSAEMDLFGSLSESFSSNSLALVPTTPPTQTPEPDAFGAPPPASTGMIQPADDPFGDSPFRAVSSTNHAPVQPPNYAHAPSFQPTMTQVSEPQPQHQQVSGFDFGDTFAGITYAPPQPPSTTPQFSPPSTDILADILPPPGPPPPPTAPPTSFAAPPGGQFAQPSPNLGGFHPQSGYQVAPPQPPAGPTSHYGGGTYNPQAFSAAPPGAHFGHQTPAVPPPQPNNDVFNNFMPQPGASSQPNLTASSGALALVPQPAKEKFDPKSTVWADTLSRGLVNLNISGAKINPLADIGIDFDAINRKEKRMEKPNPTPVTSTVTMGKAMGSGSGIGRAGAGALRPQANPMMGPGVGMGMGPGAGMGGMGPGAGMGYGGMGPGAGMGYGGMNQGPMGMGGYGMGMNPQQMGMNQQQMGMGMGMGMNMGMGRGGVPMQQQQGGMPPGYNPMMGMGGGYNPQQPYGGGYR